MSGVRRFFSFILSRPLTVPTDSDVFVRVDAETGLTEGAVIGTTSHIGAVCCYRHTT